MTKFICIEDSTFEMLKRFCKADAEAEGRQFTTAGAYRIRTGQWNVPLDDDVWEALRTISEDDDEAIKRAITGQWGRAG